MPEETPQQTVAETAKTATTNIEDAAKKAGAKIAETTQSTRAKLRGSVSFWQKWLRMDDTGDAKEESLFMTPPHLLNDIVDAVPLTAGREAYEIAESTLRNVDGAIGILSIPFGSKNPAVVGKKLLRPVTALSHFFTKAVGIGPRVLDYVGNRGVKRILQRIGYKTPLVGGLLTKGGSAIGWLTKQPRRITDWASGLTEKADNYMANYG